MLIELHTRPPDLQLIDDDTFPAHADDGNGVAGYYYGPSALSTGSPIDITTSSDATTNEKEIQLIQKEEQITYYYIGNKLWYIPLYFSFAFVVYVGYLIIWNETSRVIKVAQFIQTNGTMLKARRIYDNNRQHYGDGDGNATSEDLSAIILKYLDEVRDEYEDY